MKEKTYEICSAKGNGFLALLILCAISTFSILIFGIACSTSAQTTVCSGDSVVLVLNGYKQGSTVWQQSPDQMTWSAASGTSYKDSLVVTATNTLYYRAIVTDGTCSPFYSDTVKIIVNPVASPTTASLASNIVTNSFDANWTTSAGAITYYLDVATDAGFTAFIIDKKNLNVGNVTTYNVTGLTGGTTYYYRVRAKNSCGSSSNSNTILVTTTTPIHCTYKSTCNGNITDSRDGQIYKTVQIGSQCWMAQNLNVGTAIPGVVQQTNNTIIEKYCQDYGGTTIDSSLCATYGGLYLWDEMMDYQSSKIDAPGPKGICPTGWHLPTDNEWKCLEMTLGMSETEADKAGYRGTTEGNKLKTKGNGAPPLWQNPSTGTDASHFSALPSGGRDHGGWFGGVGGSAYFWTATEADAANAYSRHLLFGYAQVTSFSYFKVDGGFSVRCLKD